MRRDGGRARSRRLAASALAAASWAGAAHAVPVTLPTSQGEQVFDSEQFASAVLDASLGDLAFTFQGPFPVELNGITLAAAILGADLSNGLSLPIGDSLTLGFSRPGPLLAIWEAGSSNDLGETLLEASVDGGQSFSAPRLFAPEPTAPDPQPSGYATNFAFLDAAFFGLPPGSAIDALRISVRGEDPVLTHPDILAVASVPEPSSFALLGLGLAALARGGLRRRRGASAPRRGTRRRG